MLTPDARQRRLHRARAANYLATLNTSCSVEELLSIDWFALESLPHWCCIADKDKRLLCLIAGALFYAPLIQRLIDRSRIQTICSLLGQKGYQAIVAYSAPAAETFTELDDIKADDIESMLVHAGKAILLGAVQNPVIARILQEQQTQLEPLNKEVAQPLYQHALAIYDAVTAEVPIDLTQQADSNDTTEEIPSATQGNVSA